MDVLEKFIEGRRRARRPLLVWGGERLACKIGDFLDRMDVPFVGFAVNGRYWKSDSLNGHPMYRLEEYVEGNECDIVVGFGGYEEGMLQEIRMDHVGDVAALDFAGMLVLDECNVWDDEFAERHREKLYEIRATLADEVSRRALDEFVHQKRTGCYAKPFSPARQYFDGDIIRLGCDETFVDCGACRGEDTLEFLKKMSVHGQSTRAKVYSIEPDKENAVVLKERLADACGRVDVIEAAVGNVDGVVRFASGLRDQSRQSEHGDIEIPVRTIDGLVGAGTATFIKMDVEGAELSALKGGAEVVRKHHPRLAVCIYHRPCDLFDIFDFIRDLDSRYAFHFRNYMPSGVDSVLYAI